MSKEVVLPVRLNLHYLSRAEAELDIGGIGQSSSVLNQRQPVPSQWGLKIAVNECHLVQRQAITLVTVEAVVTGPSEKKIKKWVAEFEKMHGLHTAGHESKNESLLEAQAAAREKKAKYEAEQTSN